MKKVKKFETTNFKPKTTNLQKIEQNKKKSRDLIFFHKVKKRKQTKKE